MKRNKQNGVSLEDCALAGGALLFLFVSPFPFSFAEFVAVGRANSPWTANLALRARIARQGGS